MTANSLESCEQARWPLDPQESSENEQECVNGRGNS